jgi:hypothetical protein
MVSHSSCCLQAELVLDVRFAQLTEELKVCISLILIISDSQFMS